MNALNYFLDRYQPVLEGCECPSISSKGWHSGSCFASFQDPKIFYYLNLGFWNSVSPLPLQGFVEKLEFLGHNVPEITQQLESRDS